MEALAVLLLFISVACTTNALYCYQCSSSIPNSNCQKDPSSSVKKNCTREAEVNGHTGSQAAERSSCVTESLQNEGMVLAFYRDCAIGKKTADQTGTTECGFSTYGDIGAIRCRTYCGSADKCNDVTSSAGRWPVSLGLITVAISITQAITRME